MSDLCRMFQKYKDDLIVIYGLGIETKRVLTELDGKFRIIGLLDSYRVSGSMYGKPIISVHEAIDRQAALILVVARPGSCKAIAKKIGHLCRENHIALMDVRGKNLCDIKKAVYHFERNDGVLKSQLIKVIKVHDVISVDLFDTLIMRQTLFQTDIFEIMDCKLKEKEIYIEDFCEKRLDSEKQLSRYVAPTLTDIYKYMVETYSIFDIKPYELAELEKNVDCGTLIARQEMCDLLRNIFKQGKEIYIVSDTYYDGKQLTEILEKCNVDFFTDVLASCEYGTGKTQHLFKQLKEKIGDKSCVHIGDDMVADVESANKNDITACHVYSGIELFEMVGYLGLWENSDRLADRIKIGMLIARLFNSPFQFESKEQKISLKQPYDIGNLLFAPMITDFVLWLKKQVQSNSLQNVWFCARDGYLINELYTELKGNETSVYFLTSRIAAIRAGMENEEDISYVAEMKFSGTIQDQLKERFGITITKKDVPNKEDKLASYTQKILSHAFVNRRNYKAYIAKLPVKEGAIAFFDFVAKGTSQMYISRLVPNHLKGFYFLQLESAHMREKKLDIQPFYKEEELQSSAIYDNYYILETVLTAPAPSVLGFNKRGVPYFAEETRKKEDIECFQMMQAGIIDYFKTYLKLCPKAERSENKKLDEMLLELIHNIDILDETFLGLKVEDPFFNRNTDLTDLI